MKSKEVGTHTFSESTLGPSNNIRAERKVVGEQVSLRTIPLTSLLNDTRAAPIEP